ncbi:MAG: hypothetical protein ABJF01_01565 [bacterium]
MRTLVVGLLLALSLPLAAQRAKSKTPPKKADSTAVKSPAATAAKASEPWVGSSKGKTYYRTACSSATKLAAANRVYFKSEEDAKKAGYAHSTQKGC